MKTSIIGYPRVGSLRELKFTTENISAVRFLRKNYKIPQKKSANPVDITENTGLDFIPSNDFLSMI